MDEYAIRCFFQDTRKPTDELTIEEAEAFRHAALHLARYLSNEYLLNPVSEEALAQINN